MDGYGKGRTAIEAFVHALETFHGTEGQKRYRPGQMDAQWHGKHAVSLWVARGRGGKRVVADVWAYGGDRLAADVDYGRFSNDGGPKRQEWRGIPWAEAANRIGRMPADWQEEQWAQAGILDEPWNLPN